MLKCLPSDYKFNLDPYQVVCLEHADCCLFAELIQLIQPRQRCWVRPILMSQQFEQRAMLGAQPQVCDLRQGSDLIWPAALVRPVLDTEYLPLLSQLQQGQCASLTPRKTQDCLMKFMTQVWQTYPQLFKDMP